jgi:hypothetical protein
MQGISQAVMVTTVLAMLSLLLPLIVLFSGACVGLVCLRQGLKAGAMTVAGATLATGLLMTLIFGTPQLVLVFLLLPWIPVGLLAWLLRGSRSLSLATHAGLGFGLLAMVAQVLSYGDPSEFWGEKLHQMTQWFVEVGLFEQALSAEDIAQLAPLMCGVIAATYLLQLLFSLYLARWLQALLYNPGGFTAEFRQLRLHWLLGLLGGVALGLWLIPGIALPAWLNCLGLVVLSPFILQGLAVAHGVLGSMPGSQRWLLTTYILLLLFLPQMTMVLITIGLLDVWMDFRNRFSRTG